MSITRLALFAAISLSLTQMAYAKGEPKAAEFFGCEGDSVVYAMTENSIILCEGMVSPDRKGKTAKQKQERYTTIDSEGVEHVGPGWVDKAYALSPEGVSLSPDEAQKILYRDLYQPVLDDREAKRLARLRWGNWVDGGTTAACMAVKAGSEAYVSLGISIPLNVGYYYLVKHDAKATSLYDSRNRYSDIPAATHGLAALHNVATCFL